MKNVFFLARSRISLALATSILLAGWQPANANVGEITVFKDPNCGCCGKWAQHMRANGFKVDEIPTRKMGDVKRQSGVPGSLGSCHTAKIGGYIVEGHVPAADVMRLLRERPTVTGISAPGMPVGSPGMEGPFPVSRYEVVSFDAKGGVEIFARH